MQNLHKSNWLLSRDNNLLYSFHQESVVRSSLALEALVVSTTDKVYRNESTGWQFVESDPLDGFDSYSAIKVAPVAVIRSWQNIYEVENNICLMAARSGNIISGDYFEENRLIHD